MTTKNFLTMSSIDLIECIKELELEVERLKLLLSKYHEEYGPLFLEKGE